MGVGGHFWELLKPYARNEGPDFLRNKRVAVDLSFWIVQHDAAIRSRAPRARSPHLRTTFFRTVALFSKMGAFPVFVVDGEPSPLKSQARMERFLRGSGLDPSAVAPTADSGSPVAGRKRNQLFTRYVRECVELLELLGIPVLEARSEAEALCAQLNNEGHVDACITADSDAFLFGAKCVIKCFQSNSKEPFECYHISDIEAGLGLRRKQFVAVALLVGNDHDLHGVSGFGVDTAVRFVQLFTDDKILDRLSEIGKGNFAHIQGDMSSAVEVQLPISSDSPRIVKSPHCSNCGHPGSKRSHITSACEYCITDGSENCIEKSAGFRCKCSTCDKDHKFKEQRKHENWQIKGCKKIAAENNFPNQEIIDIYLSNSHGKYNENAGPTINWNKPNVDSLVDFLSYHQHWEPCYIRQRVLPMLSTIFLREKASNPNEDLLLNDQYEFDSILRVKIRYGHPYYLVKWKQSAGHDTDVTDSLSNEHLQTQESEVLEVEDSIDLVDEPDVPQILVDDGCWYLLTDENMELIQAAYPRVVERFLEEKRLKESKSKQKKANKGQVGSSEEMESPKSSAVQLSITQFYRSTKLTTTTKSTEDSEKRSPNEGNSKKSRKVSTDLDRPLSKSAKRRLLFG